MVSILPQLFFLTRNYFLDSKKPLVRLENSYCQAQSLDLCQYLFTSIMSLLKVKVKRKIKYSLELNSQSFRRLLSFKVSLLYHSVMEERFLFGLQALQVLPIAIAEKLSQGKKEDLLPQSSANFFYYFAVLLLWLLQILMHH